MKNYLRLILILLLMFGVSIGNTFSQSPKVVNNTSAKWKDNEPKIKIDFVRNIGSIDGADENYLFFMPSDIVEDKNGNLYVVDTGNHRIQKFDKNLEYISTIGREGQGPGEFKMPYSLSILDNGNLYVSDQGNRRILVLNSKGKNLETHSLKYGTNEIKINSNNEILMGGGGINIFESSPNKLKVAKLLKKLSIKGEVLGDLIEPEYFLDIHMTKRANTFTFTLDLDNNIYINYKVRNLIQKHNPTGKLLMDITRKLNYAVTNPGNSTSKGGVSADGYERSRFKKFNKISNGIAVDDKQRIWSITYNRQIEQKDRVDLMTSTMQQNGVVSLMGVKINGNTDKVEIDAFKLEVFDNQGVLLQEFPLTHFADGIKIYGDKIYILDSFRGATFYQYQVIEK